MRVDVDTLESALRCGAVVSDDAFDRVYPSTHRHRSEVHWTPVDVALTITRWFSNIRVPRVLDIGAGVGKVCHVGALATGLAWHGIEREPTMVRIAERVARALGVGERATFTRGDALQEDWTSYGAVYLFNPFREALFAQTPNEPLLREAAYIQEVLCFERKLSTLKPGSLVATYHGFGGEMPPEMRFLDRDHAGFVELWMRR